MKRNQEGNQASPPTLTDEQIVTERKHPRRAFLSVAGALLVGGAAALVSGVEAEAQNTPKAEKEGDPDKKKSGKAKKGKKSKKSDKASDPDTKK